MLIGLAAVVVAAYVAVWLVALDLAVRPPLPARLQADDVTGAISLLGDLTARLSAIGTLGFCVAANAITASTVWARRASAGRCLGSAGSMRGTIKIVTDYYLNGMPRRRACPRQG